MEKKSVSQEDLHVGCSPNGMNRRQFLHRATLTSLAAAGLSTGVLGFGQRAQAATDIAYSSRKTFDDWDSSFHSGDSAGQPDQPNDDSAPSGSGALAWGQSYVLAGLVRMYEAYRDPYYLDRLIENTDLVLGVRDSERGVTNYLGQSLPAWRANHPYTVGAVQLMDAEGQPTLEVRMGYVYCDTATVAVTEESAGGSFGLYVVHGYTGRHQTFSNLSMDPTSSNYVVRRLYDAYPGAVLVTARDLRASPAAAGNPLAGSYRMKSLPDIFAVHTGMITYPIAEFVRIVRSSPALLAQPRYKAKSDEYLAAVQAAVAVHDPEWRENNSGEGYFVWLKGSPQQWDGSAQPINQTLGLGQTIAVLADITGDETYRRRAAAMAKMFRNQVTLDPGDAYYWHYWPTFGHIYNGYAKTGSPETDVSIYNPSLSSPQRQVDDVSHGAISLEFAVQAFRGHAGLLGQDMARLARTYTQNIARTVDGLATTWSTINGSGGPNVDYANQAPRWMPIAWWDAEVYEQSLAVYEHYQPTPEKIIQERNGFGWLLGNVGQLNWYARLGD